MTLEELEVEMGKEAKQSKSCTTCDNTISNVPNHVPYPNHVFLMADEEGKTRFMEMTEDGRIVPCEEW